MSRIACFGTVGLLVAELVVGPAKAGKPNHLSKPFTVTAGGTEIGRPNKEKGEGRYDHAFPWFADFDADGKPDLLIGQHTFASRAGKKASRDGLLRIYRNFGQDGKPRFGDPIWFDDLVPTGRIPSG